MEPARLIHYFIFFVPLVFCEPTEEWWSDSFIYQVYPRSFKDSDGDGIGDLNGISSKLEHFADIGISAFWISPIYESPLADFGYDISNFTGIDPVYGTHEDFMNLLDKAHSLGLKVLLDFVPNHSSDEHEWFVKSVQRIKPYDEYYIWKDAKIVNGTRQPPNNWLSEFRGSAWEWNDERGQYYLHQFDRKEVDLNYRNPDVINEINNVFKFWIGLGVDGFRIDAPLYLFEDERFLDEPVIPNTGFPPDYEGNLKHIYTRDQPEVYDLIQIWRDFLDSLNKPKILMLTETYSLPSIVLEYYNSGSDLPMNFMFLRENLTNKSRNVDFKRKIDEWMDGMPSPDNVANWVVDNHDNPRVSERFGQQRKDQLSMLAAVLPGVGIIYYGDEIGMENAFYTYEETIDVLGCKAGPDGYAETSRDPERSPFQWDSSTSAGFSTSSDTWLAVNPNYKEINLEKEKEDDYSHYSIFKKLTALKKRPVVKSNTYEAVTIGDDVLAVIRQSTGESSVILLINFSEQEVTVDVSEWISEEEELSVYAPSVGSNIKFDTKLDVKATKLPGAASIIYA